MSEPMHIEPGRAFAALSLPTPPASGWPRLAATIAAERRRQRRRWLLPAALAASLLLLVVRPTAPPTVTEDAAPALAGEVAELDPAAALALLQAESAQLDAALYGEHDSVASAETAALRVQITDRVAWIDAVLAATPGPEASLALWSERVLLLRQLTRLHGRESWLLAAATLESATPMVSL